MNETSGKQNPWQDSGIDLGKLATVFIVFGLLSLLTSWFYSTSTKRVANVLLQDSISYSHIEAIRVVEDDEVYALSFDFNLSTQSWSQVSVEVLDNDKNYLFSFTEEASYYLGIDWVERKDADTMNITFPKAGTYYLKFAVEGNKPPYSVKVLVSKKRGSTLPHLWFGIIIIIIGIILNEVKNRTISGVINGLDS
jgi:hypothetical protein